MTQVIVYASTSICRWNSPFVWAGIEDEQTLAAVVASDSGRRNTELRLCEVGYSSIWSLKLHLFTDMLNLSTSSSPCKCKLPWQCEWALRTFLPAWHSIFSNPTPIFMLQNIFFSSISTARQMRCNEKEGRLPSMITRGPTPQGLEHWWRIRLSHVNS